MGEGDVLREGTPGCEAGLEVVVTDVLVAREALGAGAAAHGKGHGDPVACFPAAYLGADSLDGARQLVTGYVGQVDVGVVPHPAVPVAAADAGGLHADDDAVRCRRGVRHVLDGQGLLKGFVYGSAHGCSSG